MKRFWGVVATFILSLGTHVQAQAAFPPSGILRVGSQLTFELRQQWIGTISGKDADGDWNGKARATDGTQGDFVGFAVANSSNYAFQVGTSALSEYCVLSPSSLVSNNNGITVYSGTRYTQQGNNNPVNDNVICRVTLNNNAGGTTVTQPPIQPPTQPPAQPPVLPGVGQAQAQLPPLSFPPRLEIGQRWEFRLGNRPIVYRTALTGQENRSGTLVYTGTMVTDGQGDPVASRKLEAFMSGDTFAVYATDPQGSVTVCSFAGASSLQNNVLTGTVFFRTAGQSQFTTLTAPDSAPCRANLEPIQGVAQPTNPTQPVNPIQPPPTQNLNATLPAQVGDTWQVTATGFQPWTVIFTGLDDGDPAGTATQNGVRGDALGIKQNTGEYAFLMQSGNRVFVCVIPANARATGTAFTGALYELVAQGNQSSLRNLNVSCTATLTVRNTGSTGGTGIINPPVQNLMASFPPKVGQTWTVTIDGLAPWIITFRELDKDGDPNGTGVQSGASRPAIAFLSEGIKVFLMAGANNTNYYCLFAANIQPQGVTFSGGQAASKVGNGQVTSLGKSCTATLNSQTLIVLYKTKNTRVNPLQFLPIKLSPLF